jgi:homocysteine S-methyltransferase
MRKDEMSQKSRFMAALESGPLVFDGAMGTQLYERGIYINRSFDDANLTSEKLVRSVHEDYLKAGVDVLTTNTFAANRIKLRRHGLEDKIEAINRQGVQLAREVAERRAFVAGSIGPSGETPSVLTDGELELLSSAFEEQATLLAEAGVDVICLETFRQLLEVRIAMQAIRRACDLPLVVQMAFDAELRTGDGADPERVVMLLSDWGADVVGANCMEGPNVLFDVVARMVGKGTPIIAQPNAGYPRRVDERLVYMATPEYFGVYARRFFKAGIAVVGGCCGTSPEHVRSIAAAARMMGSGKSAIHVYGQPAAPQVVEQPDAVPVAERTGLSGKIMRAWQERVRPAPGQASAKLSRDNFAVSVEVNAPQGLDPTKSIEAARALLAGGIDVINIADGPRASARMANWALARLIRQQLGSEVILHVCGRDRNLLGLMSDILAYNALDLHNLVIVTGDPPKVGDYPHATAVFDLDSIGILRLVQGLNRGIDPAGKPLGDATRFFCACGAEPAAQDYERELRRLELKRAAGASLIMTQPVYDPRVLERFLQDTKHLDMPIMVGLLPLASYRNAEFLHNEVPGMSVPAEIRERMRRAGTGAAARAEGVRIAQETLEAVQNEVVGAYMMPPLGRYEVALEVMAGLPGWATSCDDT